MKKYLLVLLISANILSCGRMEVAVNWADTYTAAEADKYFDTTFEQSKKLKTSFQGDLARVKKDLFPKWAEYLKRVDADFQKGVPKQDAYLKFVNEGMEDFRKMEPYFSETAVNFMATVTPAQLDYFEKVIREKNKEDQKKVQNGKQAREEGRKKYLRWTDIWIGSLTKEQEQLLEKHLQQHPFPLELQIKNKEYRLQKLREAYKTPETLKAFVKTIVEHNDQLIDPTYQPALADYESDVKQLGYEILQTLTEKQKKAIHENLQEKISSLEKLAKD